MKVVLAGYPWTDGDGQRHEATPDKTINVSTEIGLQLIGEGKARRADADSSPTPRAARKAAPRRKKTTAPADVPPATTTEEG